MKTVLFELTDEVARITLNRPEALNAMNVELLDGLIECLGRCDDAKAVTITGAGRAFCVGEDLRETLAPATGSPEELRSAFARLQHITRLVTALPCPVVAGVHGFAIGGGAELALAADLIVASPDTQFRFPEVPLGHAVTGGATARLPASVGLARAKQLMLTGRWFSGEEALTFGMLSEVAIDPAARAREMATQLGAFPRRSMRATKSALELASVPQSEAIMRAEIDAALHCFSAAEAAEAHVAFQKSSDGARSPLPSAEGSA